MNGPGLRAWADSLLFGARSVEPVVPIVGRRPPQEGQVGGMGIWIANQVCDLVRSTTAATAVRLHLRLAD